MATVTAVTILKSLEDKISVELDNLKRGYEFEGIFKGSFLPDTIHKLVSALSLGKNLKETYDLDLGTVSTDSSPLDQLRITISGLEDINQTIQKYGSRPLNAVFNNVLTVGINQSKNTSIIRKEKSRKDLVESSLNEPDLLVRFRASHEYPASDDYIQRVVRSGGANRGRTVARFKHRVSWELWNDSKVRISLDVTSVRQSSVSLAHLPSAQEVYEVELEAFCFAERGASVEGKPKESPTRCFMENLEKVLKTLQNSLVLTTVTERQTVLSAYMSLLHEPHKLKAMYSMKPITLDRLALLDVIPHQYAVTDKADGETVAVLVFNGNVYTITINLDVQCTEIQLPVNTNRRSSTSVHNLTLVEGERLSTGKILLYDMLFEGGQDVRELPLDERLKKMDKFLHAVSPDAFKPKEVPSSAVTVESLIAHHKKEWERYRSHCKQYPKTKIDRKYFAFPKGVDLREVYAYTSAVWSILGGENGPYGLDGVIFTGVNQSYTANAKQVKLPIYKWKPPNMNSIDIYIEFVRNPNTNEPEKVYDNSQAEGRYYRLANLFVGKNQGMGEIPIPFMQNEGLHQACLFLDEDGETVRDVKGDMVNDKTVVEMVFTPPTGQDDDPRFSWSVLRTRFDKTASVRRMGRRYGNHEDVARNIMITVMYPIHMTDLDDLGGEQYAHTVAKLRATQTGSTGAYYRFQSVLASTMKRMHNYIKECVLMAIVKDAWVLDVGVGRGGDIQKYYRGKAVGVIGVDVDQSGISEAVSRYNNHKKKYPDIPPMTFLQADLGTPLDSNSQLARFNGQISAQNIKLIRTHLEGGKKKKYSVISIMFAIHYLFVEPKFSNLTSSLNRLLKQDGYVIVTTFDAHLVKEFLQGEKERTYYYENGSSMEDLFTIRDVSVEANPGLGQAIDFQTRIYMEDGIFYREYLVYPETITEEFQKRCGLVLVESMTFKDLIEQESRFFTTPLPKHPDLAYFDNVRQYFTSKIPIDVASKKLTNLYRYYLFQKRK